MKPIQSQPRKQSTGDVRWRDIILSAIIVPVLLWVGLSWGIELATRPQNLGSGLEYIGRRDNWCFVVCSISDMFSSDYFFATDMDAQEIRAFFGDTSSLESGGALGDSNFSILRILPAGQKEFEIYYYDNTANVVQTFHLKSTGKAHVVSLTNKAYDVAKAALK